MDQKNFKHWLEESLEDDGYEFSSSKNCFKQVLEWAYRHRNTWIDVYTSQSVYEAVIAYSITASNIKYLNRKHG